MKRNLKLFFAVMCCMLALSTAVNAASTYTRTLTAYYSGIKLVVDGVTVTPKDANGSTVEPFIVNGSTYLPVRAVSQALGKQVSWDGNSKTVYVGAVPGKNNYLLDVCPPYETRNYRCLLRCLSWGKIMQKRLVYQMIP